MSEPPLALRRMIPTISLAFDEGSAEEVEAARCVREACTTVGFFYIENHGISLTARDELFSSSAELFALPLDVKRSVFDAALNRGYTAWGEETLDPAAQTVGDTKEGFYIGREVAAEDAEPEKLSGPNQWPPEDGVRSSSSSSSSSGSSGLCVPSGWRASMERYFAAMSGVGYRLLRLLAIALELGDAEWFKPFFRDGVSVLRLLHYSDRVSSPDDGIYACGAHSDYGMLTLLLTDGTPGLQIREHDEWLNVESRPGELIVNLGDMLEVCIRMCYYCTARMCVRVRERETLTFPLLPSPPYLFSHDSAGRTGCSSRRSTASCRRVAASGTAPLSSSSLRLIRASSASAVQARCHASHQSLQESISSANIVQRTQILK